MPGFPAVIGSNKVSSVNYISLESNGSFILCFKTGSCCVVWNGLTLTLPALATQAAQDTHHIQPDGV